MTPNLKNLMQFMEDEICIRDTVNSEIRSQKIRNTSAAVSMVTTDFLMDSSFDEPENQIVNSSEVRNNSSTTTASPVMRAKRDAEK